MICGHRLKHRHTSGKNVFDFAYVSQPFTSMTSNLTSVSMIWYTHDLLYWVVMAG